MLTAQNRSALTEMLIACTLMTLFIAGSYYWFSQSQPVDHKKLIASLYQKGGRIPQAERDFIFEQGGNPVYGEITYDSAEILIQDMKVTRDDVLYDLGSGLGKFALQAYLTTPAKKIIGIELSATRHKLAVRAERLLKESILTKKIIPQAKELQLIHDNILHADLTDATVVFMCATCFSHELIHQIMHKLHSCKNGLRVLSLKKLENHPAFKHINKYQLPMTWSKTANSSVHHYILKK